MAKSEKDVRFWRSLASVNLYKRNQGRVTRQLTAGAIILAVVLAAWALTVTLLSDLQPVARWFLGDGADPEAVSRMAYMLRYGTAGTVAAVGIWFAYRIVNYPVFADFLVDVEGELAKVSWPATDELRRATVVVLVVMLLLSFVLFSYDVIWQQILRWIGVLRF
ncbi:MAG: preprotein translocase subunit SecE [Planctomycetaceae bacterium]|nr:preprotein translocase subunit SecE [Planctomycetaceae bacterium]